jgi:anhydro-N-acetylmuramic acid kinase
MNVHDRLWEIRRKESRRIIGLISGTSADGVSAVAAEITGYGTDTGIETLAFETYPYSPDLREDVFDLFNPETSTVDRICSMNFVLGEAFSEAALRLMGDHGLSPRGFDLVGSHGQTIYHMPRQEELHGYRSRSTLQIGEPSVIAERTGIPTVADFRKADITAGGEGAPLTPYLDYILHRSSTESRILQNIGGIANLTYLPTEATTDDVVAFDTGPGNMIIDALVKLYTDGEKSFDRDGEIASKGKVDEGLLEELLAHPYYERRPPKTTGREKFGEQYASEVARRGKERGLGFEDIVATATALTAESIIRAYERLLPAEAIIDEVYLSGGGAENDYMVEYLSSRLDPIPVAENDLLGVPAAQKEAVLMAVLANEFAMGNPANIPRATGAERVVVLGALYPTL